MTLPPRKAPIRRTRIKHRPKSKALMLRTHGTPEHRAWMKEQPCLICDRTPCDAAHLKSGGTGRKDSYTRSVPLCSTIVAAGYSGHHDEYDAGKQSFRAKYPEFEAKADAWLRSQEGAC